ncbi:MAG: hypothetical protein WC438_00915 [Candidatus Pacearchaeota archaeon]
MKKKKNSKKNVKKSEVIKEDNSKEKQKEILTEKIEKEVTDNVEEKNEKGIDSKQQEKLKKEAANKQTKQIKWVIVLMVLTLAIIVLVPILKYNFFDKFTYTKLDFQKTQMGDLFFYSTRIPAFDSENDMIGTYSINFRNDPRKLEYIEVDTPSKLFVYKKDRATYLSIDPDIANCPESSIAIINLREFLRGFALINLTSSFNDNDYANASGLPYITCENTQNNTVILLRPGNETKIEKTWDNCYELTYSNCEAMQVTEKFMLVMIENYMRNKVKA